ncbi:MAG: CBS domain-containing protein [Myxococcota bacterium]
MGMKLREIMHVEPVSLDAETSVIEAAKRMRDDGIGDVVVTEDGKVCGILTDRDIVVRGVASSGELNDMKIGSLCSRDLATLSPEDETGKAVELMEERAIRRLPVMEGDRCVGIVSLGDLAITLDRESALGQISAAPANA